MTHTRLLIAVCVYSCLESVIFITIQIKICMITLRKINLYSFDGKLNDSETFHCVTLCLCREPCSQMPLYISKVNFLHICAEVRMFWTHFLSASMGDTAWFALFSSLRPNKCLDRLKLGPQLLMAFSFSLYFLYTKRKNLLEQWKMCSLWL